MIENVPFFFWDFCIPLSSPLTSILFLRSSVLNWFPASNADKVAFLYFFPRTIAPMLRMLMATKVINEPEQAMNSSEIVITDRLRPIMNRLMPLSHRKIKNMQRNANNAQHATNI